MITKFKRPTRLMATKAFAVLKDNRYSAKSKSIAGYVLSQRPRRKKKV